jgi:putative oxidoreductase
MFIISAISKIQNIDIQIHYYPNLNTSLIYYLIIISIVIEITVAMMLIIEYKTNLAIIILLMFLMGNTIMAPSKYSEIFVLVIYKKNLAIFGGLLALLNFYVTKGGEKHET